MCLANDYHLIFKYSAVTLVYVQVVRAYLHVCHVKRWVRGRWWVIWKMKRTGGKAKMSSDVRHRMRHALEIGPRRNNLSYPHTPFMPPKSVSGEWIDGKEKRERQWQSSYVDRDISFNLVSRIRRQSPIVNVTNIGDIFCYIITTILLSMIKREIDYLLSDV